jgi:hypothetical protein
MYTIVISWLSNQMCIQIPRASTRSLSFYDLGTFNVSLLFWTSLWSKSVTLGFTDTRMWRRLLHPLGWVFIKDRPTMIFNFSRWAFIYFSPLCPLHCPHQDHPSPSLVPSSTKPLSILPSDTLLPHPFSPHTTLLAITSIDTYSTPPLSPLLTLPRNSRAPIHESQSFSDSYVW